MSLLRFYFADRFPHVGTNPWIVQQAKFDKLAARWGKEKTFASITSEVPTWTEPYPSVFVFARGELHIIARPGKARRAVIKAEKE